MDIDRYLRHLGLSPKEITVFVALYKLGLQPASTIARYTNLERTTVYKLLLGLADRNLITMSEKGGTKQFCIPDIRILQTYIKDRIVHLHQLDAQFPLVEIKRNFYGGPRRQAVGVLTAIVNERY